MKSLGEILTLSAQFLKDKNIGRARRIAEELIAHILKLKRVELYMQFDRPLLEGELEQLRFLLKRAAKEEPVEYILGEVSFCDCFIKVSPQVLIPRQETEILVSLACQELKTMDLEGKIAWDLCTGSGCIGIALKKELPLLQVFLSDLSETALRIAEENAQKNNVDVALIQGDLLTPFEGKKADIIFCNPPYVSNKQYTLLDRSVKEYEPAQALVAASDGLVYYERLSRNLPHFLNPSARVYLEIGTGQGTAVSSLFKAPCWRTARVEKDWAGHERFFFLEFE